MGTRRHVGTIGLLVALAVAPGASSPPEEFGGPFSGRIVRGVPFSAEARTTVRQTLPDGRQVERIGIARYYRDSAGRIRVEHVVSGLDPLNTTAKGQVRTIIDPDPENTAVYTLDDRTRTVNLHLRFMYDQAVGGGGSYALPIGGARWGALIFGNPERRWGKDPLEPVEERPLGSRNIDGLGTIGRRITIGSRQGYVEERWESPELQLLVYSRTSDARTGSVEYQLFNLRRTEPRADLFVIPPDYTMATTGDNGSTTLFFAENQGNSTKIW
jgi:hypothetical protein